MAVTIYLVGWVVTFLLASVALAILDGEGDGEYSDPADGPVGLIVLLATIWPVAMISAAIVYGSMLIIIVVDRIHKFIYNGVRRLMCQE